MPSREYTIETRIAASQESEIREYADSFITEYSRVYRRMWQDVTSSDFRGRYSKDSYYVTAICNRYGFLKRTVNSILREIKGRMHAYMALKKTEKVQLRIKIAAQEEKIKKITAKIEALKPAVTENRAEKEQLERYRSLRNSLYYQKNKQNKMKQKLSSLCRKIEQHIYSIGFGGKRNFTRQFHLQENGYKTHQKWYHDYVKARDRNILYLGSSDETCGNQMFQMTYHPGTDDFTAKIRKENQYCRSGKKEEQYLVLTKLQFRHLHEALARVCLSYGGGHPLSPLTYRLCRRGTRWYLQVSFKIGILKFETTDLFGAIGLDYNDGFIELSETDEHGNLTVQKHYALNYHGTGNKAMSEIRETVSQIVNYCRKKGKNLIIEDLDFKKTKAKTEKGKKHGKVYNQMLHSFDYSRYKECLQNSSHKKKVMLIMVHPYMTSRIGKQKYCEKKKLNVHQAASFVIARRGQGFEDKYRKVTG